MILTSHTLAFSDLMAMLFLVSQSPYLRNLAWEVTQRETMPDLWVATKTFFGFFNPIINP
jgi:hypothetical protein